MKKISIAKAKELLFGSFAKAKNVLKDPSKVNELLLNAEGRLKTIPHLGEKLADIPVLLSMLNDWIHKKYKISMQTLIVMIGAILYFVLPVDFIPDAVPVLGFIDDAGVISICCQMISPDINKYKQWQAVNI